MKYINNILYYIRYNILIKLNMTTYNDPNNIFFFIFFYLIFIFFFFFFFKKKKLKLKFIW